MIKLHNASEKQFHVILPNTNRALAEVLKSASPDALQKLTQSKSLGDILDSLLKHSCEANSTQNRLLLQLLQNNPTLKSLSSANTTLQELIQLLKQDKTLLSLEKRLEQFLTDIREIKPKELQKKVQTSGIFLESNIKNGQNPKELFTSDIKAILLKAQNELHNTSNPQKLEILKTIDKILLQIDYNQLVSHLSNASSFYIPYEWKDLQEGNITIKNAKDEKFFCDIHLNLKSYGELNLRLALFNNNQLSININTKSEELQSLLQKKLPTLKKQLIHGNIIPKEIRFIKIKQNEYDTQKDDSLQMGFEVKA
ncbi:MAG TPA: flagellar hook-length control protein FliK [Sulfurimonas autotrophica]|nr:flagellar hook-length control protein FliK [Sulfurimonas autotrophica]